VAILTILGCLLAACPARAEEPTTQPGREQAAARAAKLRHVGQYAAAIKALRAAQDAGADQAAWQLAMARALEVTGQYERALSHATRAAELSPTWASAVLDQGQLLETLGRTDEALAVYGTVEAILAESTSPSAAQLVAIGQILDRHAALSGQQASDQANNIFNNYFQKAYQDIDPNYWPAHIAAGQFALSKHRFKTARREFEAALQINPKLPDALVGLAEAALEEWEFEACLKFVGKALAVNPKHAPALITRGRCYLQWRRLESALKAFTQALAVNPNDPRALSLAAAACVRLGRRDRADDFIERFKAVSPGGWLLPATIAEWLSAARQFDLAEQYYRQAIDLAPKAAEPLTGLGLLYMQAGRESDAQDVLTQAHAVDDFRADVVNYLNLLEKMESFEALETEHFIIQVDGEHDAVLLQPVADEAERIYAEISKDFAHAPGGKTKIQFFPTHQQFSIRITGRGWIGTVGACTGPVVVMAAPNAQRSRFGRFNWAAVLRHELTHAVTLSKTHNRIPHWFTEACAVWQQPDRRNFESVAKLVQAVREDRFLPVRQLDWGFIRPQRRGDRTLAYAQSELAMEYIIETKGYDAILQMLDAFAGGRTQAQVFNDVLGVTEDQFDIDFVAWAKATIGGWGFDLSPVPDLKASAKAAKDHPDNADAQADLARALMAARKTKSARAAAERALELQDNHPKALALLGLIEVADGNYGLAVGYAQRLEAVEPDSPVAARVLADGYLGMQQYAQATAALEQLKRRRPLDPYSYTQLLRIYTQTGQADQALPNLIELHRRTMTEAVFARQLADTYRAAGEDETALTYYRQALHVDPYDPSTYEAMAAIHRNAGRYDEAVAAARCLTLLERSSAAAWAKLAMVRFVAARAAKDAEQMRQARDEAAESVALDADGPGEAVLKRIEAALETLEER